MLHNTTSQDFPIQTFRVTTQTQDIRDQQLKKGKKKRKRKGIKVEIPKAFKNSLTLKKTTKEKQKVFWRITGVFVWFVHHMPSTKNQEEGRKGRETNSKTKQSLSFSFSLFLPNKQKKPHPQSNLIFPS